MAENHDIEELLSRMPVEQPGNDLIPNIHASLSTARRRATLLADALRSALALLSIMAAAALIPRLGTLMELLPSDWSASAAEWWAGLETVPVESLKSVGIQLWSLPNTLAQSVGVEVVLGGLTALLLSWLTFKWMLAGQNSRKAILQ